MQDDLTGDHNGPEHTFRDTERNLRNRIASLEADNARLIGLVKEAGDHIGVALDALAAEGACGTKCTSCDEARTTLAKIKETPDAQ